MQHIVNRRTLLRAALAGSSTLAGLPARAAEGRVLFGFPPGSVPHVVGNLMLKELQGKYQPDLGRGMLSVVGNSGMRSVEALRKSPADGSAALFSVSSVLTLLPNVRKLQELDDVVAVAPVCEFTLAFVVGPGVPAEVRSMTDYVAWVRENPKLGSYGVPGMGTSHHFVGLSLARIGGLPLQPVGYQGAIPMTRDLLEGNLPAVVMNFGGAHEAESDGRLRVLAVSGAGRWPSAPEVPTLRELGMATVDVAHTMGFYMPAGTPAAKVQELNEAVGQALRSPAVSEMIKLTHMRATHSSAADYAAVIKRERIAWKTVVDKERFTIDG